MNSYFDDIQMNRINFKSVDVEVTERNWKTKTVHVAEHVSKHFQRIELVTPRLCPLAATRQHRVLKTVGLPLGFGQSLWYRFGYWIHIFIHLNTNRLNGLPSFTWIQSQLRSRTGLMLFAQLPHFFFFDIFNPLPTWYPCSLRYRTYLLDFTGRLSAMIVPLVHTHGLCPI